MVDQAPREAAGAQRRLVHKQLMPLATVAGEADPELRDIVQSALRTALPDFAAWCENATTTRADPGNR